MENINSKTTIKLSSIMTLVFCISPFVSYIKIITGFNYSPIIFDFIIFFMLSIVFINKQKLDKSFLSISILLLFTISVIQIFNNYDSDFIFKIKGFRLSGLYIVAFFIPAFFSPDSRYISKFIKINMIVSVIVFLFSIRQLIFPFGFEQNYAQMAGTGSTFLGDTYNRQEDVFRIFATFSASTHFAAYCIWIFSISSAAIITRSVRRDLAVSVLALSVVGLLITYSRTSLIALPIVAAVLAMAYGRLRNGLRGVGAAVLMASILVPAGALAATFVPMLGDRIKTIGSLENVSSFSSRLLLWAERIQQIADRPWGYGTGLAGFQEIDNAKLVTDSQYLKTFIEWGWFSGILFIAILIYMPLRFLRNVDSFQSSAKNTLYISTSSYVSGMIVIMITGQILEAYPIGIMFWYICGLAYFSNKYQDNF